MQWSKEDYRMASNALIGEAQRLEASALQLLGQVRRDFLAEARRHRELGKRFAEADPSDETG